MTRWDLGIIGVGHVGRAFLELLEEQRDALEREYDVALRVTGVATRRWGWWADPAGMSAAQVLRDGPGGARVADLSAWLALARPHAVVELTTLEPFSGEPAVTHLRAALEAGAHAITANKGPVVHAYRALSALARDRRRRFMFEAATADSVPVYSLFRAALPLARASRVRAMLNSTTTVILEAMEDGRDFDDGVRDAQALGVAEADVSLDVDGWDAAVKLAALSAVLMDETVPLERVRRDGIRGVSGDAVRDARRAGTPLRLVGTLERAPEGVEARVSLERLRPDDPFQALRGTALAFHFETNLLPALTVMGHRLDTRSTAYGVLCDVVNAARGV